MTQREQAPDPLPPGASVPWMSIAVVLLLSVGGTIGVGYLIIGAQSAQLAQVRMHDRNALRQLAVGIHNARTQFEDRVPPSVGEFAGVEGTFFLHLLPFIEEEVAFRAGNKNVAVKLYLAAGDPTAKPGSALTSFATNRAVFGTGSRRMFRTLKEKGESDTVILTERFAVTARAPHAWADTADLATWITGTHSDLDVDTKPETASADAAHGFVRGYCYVLLVDGGVRSVQPSEALGFRWACDMNKRGSPPAGSW